MKNTRFLYLSLIIAAFVISPAVAQPKTAPIPQFTPIVGWDISPTEMAEVRGLEALKLPCVMKAGFNNGFVMRLSGGGNSILAMAIDFHQQIFTRDQTYPARLNIDGTGSRSVNAHAFSDSVLIFDLKNLPDLYRQLSKAKRLGLELEGNKMVFALGNIGKSLNQLEQCYIGSTQPKPTRMIQSNFSTGSVKKASSQLTSSDPAPNFYSGTDLSRPRISRPVLDGSQDMNTAPRMAAAELAKSMREPRLSDAPQVVRPPEIVKDKRVEKLEMPENLQRLSEPVLATPRVSIPRAPVMNKVMISESIKETVTPSNIWSAKAGDDMKATLEGWASRAGVELQWQASNDGRVARDVSVDGTFEQAVQTLMAQNAAVLGIEADMKKPAMKQSASSNVASNWQASMGASKWIAASGASLRETLQRWSIQEGVAFLWKAGKEYKVKEPVQNNDSYEEALQQLLNQYADDTMRPAAELNIDPSGGGKLLTIE